MDVLDNFTEAQKVALEHAREWFSLHARQRMQSVYYFIVAAAFLFGTLTYAANTDSPTLGLAVSFLGGFLSYIFYRLDHRVRSLIHAAEAALIPLEKELARLTKVPSIEIVSRVRSPLPGGWVYSKVFRFLYGSIGTAFALVVLYSVWKLASNVPIFSRAFYVTIQLLIGVFLGILGFELLQTNYLEIKNSRIRTFRNITYAVLGILFLLTALSVFIYLVFWQLPSAVETTL